LLDHLKKKKRKMKTGCLWFTAKKTVTRRGVVSGNPRTRDVRQTSVLRGGKKGSCCPRDVKL